MSVYIANVHLDNLGMRPAAVKEGHKHAHCVINDVPNVRVVKVAKHGLVAKPLLSSGKPHSQKRFKMQMLQAGKRYNISKRAKQILETL